MAESKKVDKIKRKMKEKEDKHKREMDRKKEEINELESQIKELQQINSSHLLEKENALLDKEKTQVRMDKTLEKNEQLMSEVVKMDSLKADIRGLELKIEEHLMTIDSLKMEIRSKDTQVSQQSEFTSKLKLDLQTEISKIENLRAKHQGELSEARHAVDSKDAELQRIQAHFNEMDKNISILQNEKVEFKDRYDQLEVSNIKLREGILAAENGIISNLLPNLIKGDQQALEKIKDVLSRLKHNAIIALPVLDLLPEILPVDTIKSKQNFRIMAFVELDNPKHRNIFDQYNMINISIRAAERKNVWGIIRDQEEMLVAPEDESGNPVGLVITDDFQIEIIGNVLLNLWSRCKKNLGDYDFKV